VTLAKEKLNNILQDEDNIVSLISKLADRGQDLTTRLRNASVHPHESKSLRSFSIGQTAEMVGVSTSRIRELEREGRIAPKDSEAKMRTYTLAEVNSIRDILNRRPRRPAGQQAMVISVVNQKGGAGKTSTSVHAAQFLALKGYRVLVLDCDPQASTTMSLAMSRMLI
jgi:chromosome partitioning protein